MTGKGSKLIAETDFGREAMDADVEETADAGPENEEEWELLINPVVICVADKNHLS